MKTKATEREITDFLIAAMRMYGLSETAIAHVLAMFWEAV